MKAQLDTLTTNPQVVETFQHSSDYDYARAFVESQSEGESFFTKLLRKLFEQWDIDISAVDGFSLPSHLHWILYFILALAVAYLLYKFKFKLFFKEESEEKQEADVDNIHEVDFDSLISKAKAEGNHTVVCRLLYLKTLKDVSDAHLIDWQRYKTPTQYSQEWGDEHFKVMTNHFLRVRYGDFEATPQLTAEMESLREHVMKQVKHARANSDTQAQEGGEA